MVFGRLVNGQWQVRMARINLYDGSLYAAWQNVDASAKITTIDEWGGRLFVGGDFTSIGGQSIGHLAELDPETGAVNTAFSFDFTGSSPMIHAAEIVQNGTRLAVVHQATSIDGELARSTAVFDISSPANPSKTPHRMSVRPGVSARKTTGGDVSPDGQWIVVGQGFATSSDYVYLVPVSDVATSIEFPNWPFVSAAGISLTIRTGIDSSGNNAGSLPPGT